MAEPIIAACPECKKKFKPKTDVRGKKIKCPFCKTPFVVPAEKAGAAKSDKAKASEPKPTKSEKAKADPAPPPTPPPAPAAEEKKPDSEFDNDPNPYGVATADLTPRCPNCTQEMGPSDIICLACGYNTLTREWGKTEKTLGVTTGQHLKHLLPAIGAATFLVGSIIFLMYYCIVSPYHVQGVMILHLTDHESLRMWTTVLFLGQLWAAGVFCFKKFIEKPVPDEIEIEETK